MKISLKLFSPLSLFLNYFIFLHNPLVLLNNPDAVHSPARTVLGGTLSEDHWCYGICVIRCPGLVRGRSLWVSLPTRVLTSYHTGFSYCLISFCSLSARLLERAVSTCSFHFLTPGRLQSGFYTPPPASVSILSPASTIAHQVSSSLNGQHLILQNHLFLSPYFSATVFRLPPFFPSQFCWWFWGLCPQPLSSSRRTHGLLWLSWLH